MNCLTNENVCSVKKEDQEGYYRIHTIWMNDRFRINIASKNASWTGEMSPESIKKISEKLNMDDDKYLIECKEALTTDDGKKGYSYAVENGSFTWKKMIDEDTGMKIKMGSVIVEPSSFIDTIQNMNEVLLSCKKNLIKQISQLLQQHESNLQRISQLQNKLKEVNENKVVMERDIYSKFLLLLNTKKRKIKDLKSSLLGGIEYSGNKYEQDRKTTDDSQPEIAADIYNMDTDEEDYEITECTSGIKSSQRQFHHSRKNIIINCTDNKSKINEANKTNSSKILQRNEDYISQEEKDAVPSPVLSEIGKICKSGCSNSQNENIFPKSKTDILDFFFGSS